MRTTVLVVFGLGSLWHLAPDATHTPVRSQPISIVEASIADIHDAFQAKRLTSRELVQLYLGRIKAYDQKGPSINSIITLNPKALEQADRLDAAFAASGMVGPLHGIPVVLKDQIDAVGMPTTLGSVLLENYYPDRDAFVVAKLRKAGAIIFAKTTLGEFGGGDTHGSLFGSTRNPYALDRTAGGSSGGSAAAIASNFATVAVGQEGNASIRRPSTWNSIVGMRPTAGLVSRGGVYGGWPQTNGSAGPMARNVTDLAILLDTLVGYDPEDPITALGVGHVPATYTAFLERNGLRGSRLGVLREPIGLGSEPETADFRLVEDAFGQAIGELAAAGAQVVDPITVPRLRELMATRTTVGDDQLALQNFFGRSAAPPFRTRADIRQSPGFSKLLPPAQGRAGGSVTSQSLDQSRIGRYLVAREELTVMIQKVMADHRLDAIVYNSVEHQPTLIRDGVNPPYVSSKGVPNLNTFLVFVPAITVPAGFTRDGLPVGITFQGRPYEEGTLIKLAYAYEQATRHRKPPASVPPLPMVAQQGP